MSKRFFRQLVSRLADQQTPASEHVVSDQSSPESDATHSGSGAQHQMLGSHANPIEPASFLESTSNNAHNIQSTFSIVHVSGRFCFLHLYHIAKVLSAGPPFIMYERIANCLHTQATAYEATD